MRYLFIIVSVLVLMLHNSCRRSQPPLYENSDLNGNWVRLASTKPKYDSMVIIYHADTLTGGFITEVPSGGNFEVGQLKWRKIVPSNGSDFDFEDRGSDGEYYEGTMTYTPTDNNGNSVLKIKIEFGGHQNGEEQTWVRY